MKRSFLAVLASLMMAGMAFGADPDVKVPEVKIPQELKVKPGRLIRIKAESNTKVVKWALYSDDADLIPFESTKEAIFSSPNPGKYRVLVYTALGDVPSDPAVCIVTVEGVVPPPVPPTPPTPPVPPAPVDPFVDTLAKAYSADATTDKAAKLQTLVKLWSNSATKTVNDPDIKTVGDMFKVLSQAGKDLLGNDLTSVREAIRVELDTKLPKKADTPLDDVTRKLMETQFKRVADALGKVK